MERFVYGVFPCVVLMGVKMSRFSSVATSELLLIAREVLGLHGKWEAPVGERKNWRLRKQDGTYEYRDTPPEGNGTSQKDVTKNQKKPGESPSSGKVVQKQKKIVYKMHLNLDKPKLQETLTKGHFTLISAGRNPNDPKESPLKPDDEMFHKRHEELRGELEKSGMPYTEVVGHYGGQEPTFLVFHDNTEITQKTQKSIMVHHKNADEGKKRKKILEELGKKFNQDSVLHGSAGRNDIVFTSGTHKGKVCGGKGWREVPDSEDFYTDIELADKNHTKFTLDIQECFDRGLL